LLQVLFRDSEDFFIVLPQDILVFTELESDETEIVSPFFVTLEIAKRKDLMFSSGVDKDLGLGLIVWKDGMLDMTLIVVTDFFFENEDLFEDFTSVSFTSSEEFLSFSDVISGVVTCS